MPDPSKSWLLYLTGFVALVASGFVLVTEVIKPGKDSGSEPARSGLASGGDDELVIRALGDSVTAGFGYRDDGVRIAVSELPRCARRPADSSCQDPDGVAYPAVFASRQRGADFENLAESGSTAADWLGEGRGLSSTLDDVVEADPDITVLTAGANPLLQRFLIGGDRVCATTATASAARACVRRALIRENVLIRLSRIYATLLETPEDGRNGLVVVFQYPETVPPSAFGVRVRVLIEELRSTIEKAAAAVRETNPEKGERLVVADPGPFLQHGCTAPEPWILRVDTCIHPNARGHKQMADVLEGMHSDRSTVRPPGGPLSATAIGPARIGMSTEEVESVFTRPDRTAAGGEGGIGGPLPPNEDAWLWDYPNPGWIHTEDLSGVSLYFVDGRLHRFYCASLKCATEEGIRVGDDVRQVRRTYGDAVVGHPAFAHDPDCCGVEVIVPADDADLFPALSFSGDGDGRNITIGGGYDAYESDQPVSRRFFSSPSGNIVCKLTSDSAICDIADYEYEPPPRPAGCQLDWGFQLEVSGTGPGGFNCAGQGPSVEAKPPGSDRHTALPYEAPILRYRESASAGDFICRSTEAGITCRNSDTGHGFRISRESASGF